MSIKLGIVAAVAATFLFAPVSAEAGTRFHLQFFAPFAYHPTPEDYYPGPLDAPGPRYSYDLEDEDDYSDEPDVAYAYEPDYYEPDYVAPAPREFKPRKPRVSAPRKPLPAPKFAAKPRPSVAKPAVAKFISCTKATGIVADYGFGDVKSTDCEGQSYAFNATRDGKPYVIKLSARTGELTEVVKQ